VGNKLSINVAKTEHMFFGSNFRLSSLEKTVPIFLGHKQIKRVKHTKYLGSYLDENLKWEEHIDNINVREGGGGYSYQPFSVTDLYGQLSSYRK